MLVLVTGDREWKDKTAIRDALREHHAATVIEGECLGADLLAKAAAGELGLQVAPMPADWKRYGQKAGNIRNQDMLELKPDLALAFHDDLRSSAGTRDMVYRLLSVGVTVYLYAHVGSGLVSSKLTDELFAQITT